jgi:phosphatidylglycerol:prolipoprotein diacylglycerol transferase
MVLTLVLFGAILPFHQRLKTKLPDGVLGLTYLGLYGVGRFFLSYFRTDPAVFAGMRQAQLASVLMVAIAVVAIPILLRRRRALPPGTELPAAKPAELEVDEAEPAERGQEEPEPAKAQDSEHAEPVPAQVTVKPKRRRPTRIVPEAPGNAEG